MKLGIEGLSLSGKTVIVVEDDPTLQTLLVDILVELGAICDGFDNSEDALIHLMGLKSGCSLIVVDHGVPGSIKGMEFISMAHERWSGLPAILTSGHQLDASQVTPPVTYLFKPWSIDELAQAIVQALPPANVPSTLPPLDQQGL
ncbi:response regulator [Pseudomonas sp. BN505]|uniref:response regulator n=1 Tax=unclassified Pseudomonas TaxID=196821 RepID=UPI0024589A2F|nr:MULTISPECIES: response regulator [unclassified Pseudomonas]MDH4842456.1 response regulator [Pseudomonas sp. BN605]MDH4858191.1 response regulator [Pseudomonas sp. BN505]